MDKKKLANQLAARKKMFKDYLQAVKDGKIYRKNQKKGNIQQAVMAKK